MCFTLSFPKEKQGSREPLVHVCRQLKDFLCHYQLPHVLSYEPPIQVAWDDESAKSPVLSCHDKRVAFETRLLLL